MIYNLYIDVLFIVNLIMDFLLLIMVGKVFGYRIRVLRMLLSASLGAAWAVCITLFPYLPVWLECAVTYVGISVGMLYIAYSIRTFRAMLKAVAALYLAALMMAGAYYAIWQHSRAGDYLVQLSEGINTKDLSFGIWILLAAGLFFAIRGIWLYVKEEKIKKIYLYTVILHYQGGALEVMALLDTGNHLCEPITGKPVYIITYEACKNLCQKVSAVTYIPYQSLGNPQGILPAIYFDRMEIVLQEGGRIQIERPLLAICKQTLSPEGNYQMLLQEEAFRNI